MHNFYEIKIVGKDIKRFIRSLYRKNIQLHKIEWGESSVILLVDREGLQKIKEIKTVYQIDIVGYYGIFKLEYYFRKYFLFLCNLVIGVFLILFLSHLIFDVQVVHVKEEMRSFIAEELAKEGIRPFHFQKSFDEQEKIVKKIVFNYRDKIEWLEIERVGTKYIAKVEERKYSPLDKETEPRDIIAKKDGRILQLEVAEGTILVAKDQYVKKGDILVSGQIKNKDTVMAKVRSKGKVYATTWYTVQVSLPYHYQEEIKTGRKRKALSIQFLSNRWNLFQFSSYQDSKVTPLFQIKNNLLPFSISWNEEEEIRKTDKVYTRELAILEASSLAREKLKNQLGSDIEILYEKSLKITEEDSKIDIEIFLTVKEDITAYQKTLEELPNTES